MFSYPGYSRRGTPSHCVCVSVAPGGTRKRDEEPAGILLAPMSEQSALALMQFDQRLPV